MFTIDFLYVQLNLKIWQDIHRSKLCEAGIGLVV